MTPMVIMSRLVGSWCSRAFGYKQANSIKDRALRVLEEAAELCQAEDCDDAKIRRTIEMVLSRPRGKPYQEFGGVMLTAMAYTQAKGIDLESCALVEVDRVLSLPLEKFQARQAEKEALGVVEK